MNHTSYRAVYPIYLLDRGEEAIAIGSRQRSDWTSDIIYLHEGDTHECVAHESRVATVINPPQSMERFEFDGWRLDAEAEAPVGYKWAENIASRATCLVRTSPVELTKVFSVHGEVVDSYSVDDERRGILGDPYHVENDRRRALARSLHVGYDLVEVSFSLCPRGQLGHSESQLSLENAVTARRQAQGRHR